MKKKVGTNVNITKVRSPNQNCAMCDRKILCLDCAENFSEKIKEPLEKAMPEIIKEAI